MLENLKTEMNITYTENGARAYASSLSHCLDLFATIGGMRHAHDNEIINRFIRAFTENPDLAVKMIFYARDVRGGLGERRVFRVILKWLCNNKPKTVIRNIGFIGEYGRFDDLLELLCTPCEGVAVTYIAEKLKADKSAMTNGGKVINYVLAQGSVEEVMYRVGETGATVGRAIGSGRTTLLEKLDIAQANGMMATVTLFNHEDIRDPAVREKVIETINIAKDHPALFGWYLWEEPSFSGDNIDLDENIRIGTKLIRDMDPDHPIGSVIPYL